MAGSTIDHLVSITVLLGVLLLSISLFNQTIQTAILYQRHKVLSMKCSDLLDNMLLNPGIPKDWGRSNVTPIGFGLQDPEFFQYKLSPFSIMRLHSAVGEPVYYPKTGQYYSNVTSGFGKMLLVPFAETINYSLGTRLLGIDGTYGFRLTITPIVAVSIEEIQSKNPLKLSVKVAGTGFPLPNAEVSYCFLQVSLTGGEQAYPAYRINYGKTHTDVKGSVLLEFPEIKSDETSYVLIAYASLSGLVGVGTHLRVNSQKQYIIPFINSFEDRKVLIAHSYDVHYFGPPEAELKYNATFLLLAKDFTLREMPLENATGKVGKVVYGEGWPYGVVTIPTYNPGILIITYKKSANEGGVVLMPWGISSLSFPVVFGGNPSTSEWVATDIRQVTVNNIAYQVILALWSLEGYQVIEG